jgi:HK97 family phage prohead protease
MWRPSRYSGVMGENQLHGPFVLDVGLPTVKSLAEDDGDILIEGYAADFKLDRQGEKFLAGAFDEAIEKAAQGKIPLLLEHSNDMPLGLVEELRTDENGLWVRGRIAAKAVSDAWDGAKGKVELIRRGVMKGLSVRGHSWGRMSPEGPEIGHIDLAEISITPVPVQPGAVYAVVQKSMDYAIDGSVAAPDIAWAAEGWSDVLKNYTEDEIRSAMDTFYKDKIKETKAKLKDCQARLDEYVAAH